MDACNLFETFDAIINNPFNPFASVAILFPPNLIFAILFAIVQTLMNCFSA